MILPRRPLVWLIPPLCLWLVLASCAVRPKQAGPDAAVPTATPSVITIRHLRVVEKHPSDEFPADGNAHVHRGVTYVPAGRRQRGIASWYGKRFHGRRTACGETFNMHGDTAAHRTLPMHTRVLVRNLDNGRSTVVRINDRGPYVRGRIIDLSYAKARELGFAHKGKARVELVALKPAGKTDKAARTPKTIKTESGSGTKNVPRLTPAGSKRRVR